MRCKPLADATELIDLYESFAGASFLLQNKQGQRKNCVFINDVLFCAAHNLKILV